MDMWVTSFTLACSFPSTSRTFRCLRISQIHCMREKYAFMDRRFMSKVGVCAREAQFLYLVMLGFLLQFCFHLITEESLKKKKKSRVSSCFFLYTCFYACN